MKSRKRIFNFILAAVMAVCSFSSATVFAKETTVADVYTFEVNAETDEGHIVMPLSDTVDQSFTMTTSHRGADRTYSNSNLRYAVTITDANGNAVDNRVVVSLNDYNSGAIQSSSVYADGSTYGYDVPIVSGRTYYFTYNKVEGTTRTLRVHMYIYSHN